MIATKKSVRLARSSALTVLAFSLFAWPLAILPIAHATEIRTTWPPSGTLIPLPAKQANNLQVMKTARLLNVPLDKDWTIIPAFHVAIQPQQITAPGLAKGTISDLEVQAITDNKSIAWRLTWEDSFPDGNVDTSRFSDAVAIEFPIGPDAAATMGHPDGGRVQILYWKALWQKDKDAGFQDIHTLHPNIHTDLYWFATGSAPYPVATAFKDPRSQAWLIALTAGNPMAVVSRAQPVEELTAEGWGTLTHQPDSATTAAGVWAAGRWSVVFIRPLRTDDSLDYQFQPSINSQIAFAVWQGGAGNTGGRKHWADWVDIMAQK